MASLNKQIPTRSDCYFGWKTIKKQLYLVLVYGWPKPCPSNTGYFLPFPEELIPSSIHLNFSIGSQDQFGVEKLPVFFWISIVPKGGVLSWHSQGTLRPLLFSSVGVVVLVCSDQSRFRPVNW